MRLHFGSVATDWYGYQNSHSTETVHSVTLETGERINRVQLYYGVVPSVINNGMTNKTTALTFYTDKGDDRIT